MKWQNLTNGIYGAMIAILLCTGFHRSNIANAQENEPGPLLLKKCWAISDEDSAKQIYASDNDFGLLLAKTSGRVGYVDKLTGKRIWLSDFGGDISSNLVADNSLVVFSANRTDGGNAAKPATTSVRAISKKTGIPVWTVSVPYSEISYLGSSEDIVISVALEGHIVALRKSDGSVIWQSSLGKKLSSIPYFSGNTLFLSDIDGTISSVALRDGSFITQLRAASVPSSIFNTDDNTLVWGDAKGTVTAVDATSKVKKWKFKTGGLVSGISSSGTSILVTSFDNFVYLMSPGGRVIWKRRLSGRAAEKPLVTGDSVIVTIAGEPGAVFIDLKSGRIQNRVASQGGDHSAAYPVMSGDLFIFADATEIYSYTSKDCTPKIKNGTI